MWARVFFVPIGVQMIVLGPGSGSHGPNIAKNMRLDFCCRASEDWGRGLRSRALGLSRGCVLANNHFEADPAVATRAPPENRGVEDVVLTDVGQDRILQDHVLEAPNTTF